jgi:hypothetical protein
MTKIDRFVKWWTMRKVPKHGPYYAEPVKGGITVQMEEGS